MVRKPCHETSYRESYLVLIWVNYYIPTVCFHWEKEAYIFNKTTYLAFNLELGTKWLWINDDWIFIFGWSIAWTSSSKTLHESTSQLSLLIYLLFVLQRSQQTSASGYQVHPHESQSLRRGSLVQIQSARPAVPAHWPKATSPWSLPRH